MTQDLSCLGNGDYDILPVHARSEIKWYSLLGLNSNYLAFGLDEKSPKENSDSKFNCVLIRRIAIFLFLEYCIFFPSDYRLNSYPLVHSVNRHGLILGNTNANGIFYCLIYISLMTNDTEYLFM